MQKGALRHFVSRNRQCPYLLSESDRTHFHLVAAAPTHLPTYLPTSLHTSLGTLIQLPTFAFLHVFELVKLQVAFGSLSLQDCSR